jgi:hypothetical protein
MHDATQQVNCFLRWGDGLQLTGCLTAIATQSNFEGNNVG